MPNLRKARERAKLTQAQLAEKAGVGRTTIAKLEAGQATPQPETARRLAEALSMNALQLRFEPPPRDEAQLTPNRAVSGQSLSAGNGIVERHVDGSVQILLDSWIDEDVQVALFGRKRKHLTEPPKTGMFRSPGSAQNMLHLRELPTYAVAALADVDEPPEIHSVTVHGLVLCCYWIDSNVQHLYLLHVPWSLVLGIDSRDSYDLERERERLGRAAQEESDDLAE